MYSDAAAYLYVGQTVSSTQVLTGPRSPAFSRSVMWEFQERKISFIERLPGQDYNSRQRSTLFEAVNFRMAWYRGSGPDPPVKPATAPKPMAALLPKGESKSYLFA